VKRAAGRRGAGGKTAARRSVGPRQAAPALTGARKTRGPATSTSRPLTGAAAAAAAAPRSKPRRTAAAPKPKVRRPRLVAEAAAADIVRTLHRLYPEAQTALLHEDPLQLLVATILSAQSTDERVNQVTRTLFRKYRTADDFAGADVATFELEIRPTGFFRNKTKLVIGAATRIRDVYGGKVPETMEELLTLPGVARKTANVVLGSAFGKAEGVVVDTHIRRLSYRLGLSLETDPVKVERDLVRRLPREEWIFIGHALIFHGRRICVARKPRCSQCALAEWCPRNGVTVSA
jgi:endonuclease-3